MNDIAPKIVRLDSRHDRLQPIRWADIHLLPKRSALIEPSGLWGHVDRVRAKRVR
jgi:hypothetical protein